MPRLRPLRRAHSIWLGSALLGGMLCLELICRFVLGLGTPPLYVADPQIEYMLKPNQDVRRFGNRILVNQWGMRSQPFEKTKTTPDEFRVLVIGDSVINGGSQTDHEQLATTLLQTQLAKVLKRPVTVGNISAGSWGPGNWRAYIQRFGHFSADAVVLVVNSGDYADNPSFEPLNPSTHPTETPWLALDEALSRYLPRYLPRRLQPSQPAPEPAPTGSGPAAAEIQRGLADLLAFLNDWQLARIPLIVMHHPEAQEVASVRYLPGYDRIRRLAMEVGVPFV